MDSKTKLTLSDAINLLHGDCLELMKNIPDKSIDMVLCDPPYGTTACKWDVVIPFEPMWNELKRITKDNGAICLFGSEPFSSHLRVSNLKMFKYDWIWDKKRPTGFALVKRQPMRQHEVISVFYGSQPSYIRQFSEKKKENQRPNRKANSILNPYKASEIMGTLSPKFSEEFDDTKKNPVSIIQFSNSNHGKLHPTQKPVALLEYLIKTYTLENETVLDFTMGSGSTGVACVNLNRKFVGIEKDDKYFKIAQDRIDSSLLESFQ